MDRRSLETLPTRLRSDAGIDFGKLRSLSESTLIYTSKLGAQFAFPWLDSTVSDRIVCNDVGVKLQNRSRKGHIMIVQ